MPINSFLYPAPTNSNTFEVANSLRFDAGSSDNLSQTQSSGETKTFTYSCWFKKVRTLGSSDQDAIFTVGENNTNDFILYFQQAEDIIDIIVRDSSTIRGRLTTNRKFRDYSAWMHIVFVYDSTNATAGNRMRLYINGVEETSFANDTNPGLNQTTVVNNSSYTMRIGRLRADSSYLSGYLAECVLIDGQALDPTSFGQFDEDTNIWKPKEVLTQLDFGTNGFYLEFKNASSLGTDSSTNGNNFTVNNLTSIDQTTDTCTNNFATGNPLDYSGTAPTLGNGNLSITSAELSDKPFRTTIAVSQGKWYMEYKCEKSGSDNDNHIGLWSAENSLTSNYVGYQLYSWGIFTANGNKRNSQSYDSYGSAIAQNDIVMIALDKDNGKIWWGKNGTWFASGNPATGSNEAFSNINTVVGSDGFVSFCFLPQQKFSLNFGSPPYSISSGNADGNGYGNFEYAVPSGYYALNTKNLAEYG